MRTVLASFAPGEARSVAIYLDYVPARKMSPHKNAEHSSKRNFGGDFGSDVDAYLKVLDQRRFDQSPTSPYRILGGYQLFEFGVLKADAKFSVLNLVLDVCAPSTVCPAIRLCQFNLDPLPLGFVAGSKHQIDPIDDCPGGVFLEVDLRRQG